MYYQIYRDARGEWRWRFRAANHRILADSAEGYSNREDCLWVIGQISTSGNAKVHDA
jgi:uncharacterized protein